MERESGVDLLALALLMATLSDWLAICQRRVPVVYCQLDVGFVVLPLNGIFSHLKTWREHSCCNN